MRIYYVVYNEERERNVDRDIIILALKSRSHQKKNNILSMRFVFILIIFVSGELEIIRTRTSPLKHSF